MTHTTRGDRGGFKQKVDECLLQKEGNRIYHIREDGYKGWLLREERGIEDRFCIREGRNSGVAPTGRGNKG